ncbi:MAG: prepilin-type N-terminal cleavage/methylation domain-containing protein [Phycisphaerae bacterium]|nr:prepilin-type N-terminal cleavage/methylation domain-containing protein [Phycisphaerae bacterium]
MKKIIFQNKGFTLAEVLMAVWVMSIILAAVATLSFALSSANDSADDTSDIQSKVRYTTIRLGDLIKNSKLICYNFGTELAVWRADDNGDSKINGGELVYIETGGSNNCIKILEFKPTGGVAEVSLLLTWITDGSVKSWFKSNCPFNYTTLIDNCSYATFTTDTAAPFSKKVSLFFGIGQNGIIQNYQLNTYLRCQADSLLSAGGQIVSDDDL